MLAVMMRYMSKNAIDAMLMEMIGGSHGRLRKELVQLHDLLMVHQ